MADYSTMGDEGAEIEIRVRALKNTLGIIDHYYMVIDDWEYHPGFYKLGCILPKGSTKGYHVACRRLVCQDCFNLIMLNFNLREDKRMFSLYPVLNCESLAIGFSVQSTAFLVLPFIACLLCVGRILYSCLLFLCVLTTLLMYSKYVFSRTERQRCRHIVRNNTQ